MVRIRFCDYAKVSLDIEESNIITIMLSKSSGQFVFSRIRQHDQQLERQWRIKKELYFLFP